MSTLAVGLMVATVHTHPQCQNFDAPNKGAPPLQFCKHSNGAVDGTCCSAAQDGAIAQEFAALIAAAVAPVSDDCKTLQVVWYTLSNV